MSKFLLGLGIASLLALGAPARAQGDAKPKVTKAQDSKQEPATLQQRAFAKYQELKASIRRLQGELQNSDPDKARRLKAGLVLMQEQRLEEQMKDIEALLKEESWDTSIEKMKRVQKDLVRLLNLLMDRDVDLQEILEEIARLEDYKKKVEALIEEQQKEKDLSAQAEAIEKQLRDIERAKADVQRLIDEQKKLKDATESKGAGKKDSTQLEQRQGELKEDAQNLEQDLEEIEQQAKELDAAEGAGEGKGEGKGEGSGSGSGSGSGKGSSAAGAASKSMGDAQQKLGNQQPESSLDDQKKAIDKLEDAKNTLDDLEADTRRRLMELPFERFAREQLETMQKTQKLADEMEKGDGKGEGEDGNGGKPTPGQQNVQQAVPEQKNAAGSLKKYKPGKSKKDQQDAEDQLQEAKQKLEDALAQLRQELHQEVLRALEERFTEMLAKQREITTSTAMTHKWRSRIEALVKGGLIPASVKDRCHRLAEGEADLKQKALDALELMIADGSSAVFPEIIKGVADDLTDVTGFLDGFDTGAETQEIQKQIEKTLEQLLDALTERIEEIESNGGT